MTKAPNRKWIPSLAGFRAIAALAVFAFHLISIDAPSGFVGAITTPLGNAAVTVFFTLSGFLIYQPFVRWAFGTGPNVPAAKFMAKRAFRILPLYWVVLSVHLVLRAENGYSFSEMLTAYGLIQNFRGELVFVPPFVAWSLCIELWFSLALPFIAAPLRWLGRRRSGRTALLIQSLGVTILVGSAVFFRMWALSGDPASGRLLWVPAYFDWFGGGLLLAVWTGYLKIRAPSFAFPRFVAKVFAALGIGSYVAVTQLGLPGGFEAPTPGQTQAQFAFQGFMGFAFVAAAVLPSRGSGRTERFLSSPPLAWLGAVSYGIYLIHPVVVDELILLWPEMSLWAIGGIALAITLTAAQLLHVLVEIPGGAFGGRLYKTSWFKLGDLVPQRSRPAFAAATLTVAAVAAPLLSRPGYYVADARFEVFADPLSRLSRMISLMDPSRDLGRPSEEFWPAITLVSSGLSALQIEPWLIERLWHGLLLAAAGLGSFLLSRALCPNRLGAALIAGALYAFGPFSAIYPVPSTLYVSHAIAPWAVLAVLRASQGKRPMVWAGLVALMIFGAGNADPPGLLFALLPAGFTAIGLAWARPQRRRPLLSFAAITGVASLASSAAMLFKTFVGASALAHRLAETESAAVIASTSSFSESIRAMGFWLTYFRFTSAPVRAQQDLFVSNGWMILATVLPLLAGICALLWRSPGPRLLALGFVVLGTVIMAGPFPVNSPTPYGRLLLWLYENSEIAFGFRSTHKAGVILALGVALLGGWGLADLAGYTVARLRPFRRLPALIVAALLLALTQPFWNSELYDPAATSIGIPDHWQELGAWFEANPPDGRVLVLPGSTNNGYLWGSVGDDLLDPLVPNRVVASTLPLSMPLGADLVEALDTYLTSGHYQPGALKEVASRAGISHVLLRNDLDFQRVGVADPTALDPLRSDPDLSLEAAFGVRGLYTSSHFNPQIEVYRVGEGAVPGPVILPASAARRQIIVDGDAGGLLRLSMLGALDAGHPVRYAGTLDKGGLAEIAPDTALVVLTDTNLRLDRRIDFYGYRYAQPARPDGDIPWLPDFAAGAASNVVLEGAQVGTTIDRWLQGAQYGPSAALDGDNASSWLLPVVSDVDTAKWWIEFDGPKSFSNVRIDLEDVGSRVRTVSVSIDGKSIPSEVVEGTVYLELNAPINRLEISFVAVAARPGRIGVREVTFGADEVQTFVALPDRLARLAASDPRIEEELSDANIWIVVGEVQPSSAPIRREFSLWRADEFLFDAVIQTAAATRFCSDDVLTLDGRPVSVLVTPDGSGRGIVSLCNRYATLALSAGTHRLEVTPRSGERWSIVKLESARTALEPIQRLPLDLSVEREVETDDLVIMPTSFDSRWTLGPALASTPFALDAQTAWRVTQAGEIAAPNFEGDDEYRVALFVTAAGLVFSLALIVTSRWTEALFAHSAEPTRRIQAKGQPDNSKQAWLVDLFAVIVAWAVGGTAGAGGAVIALIVAKRHLIRPPVVLSAVAITLTTALSAWPVIQDPGMLVVPATGDLYVRLAIGSLIVALRLGFATSHIDQTVPGRKLT